jgi:hypothetical protein
LRQTSPSRKQQKPKVCACGIAKRSQHHLTNEALARKTFSSPSATGPAVVTTNPATNVATHSATDCAISSGFLNFGGDIVIVSGHFEGRQSRADGLDFAYAFNRGVTTAEHNGITGQIDGFLDAHGSRL